MRQEDEIIEKVNHVADREMESALREIIRKIGDSIDSEINHSKDDIESSISKDHPNLTKYQLKNSVDMKITEFKNKLDRLTKLKLVEIVKNKMNMIRIADSGSIRKKIQKRSK